MLVFHTMSTGNAHANLFLVTPSTNWKCGSALWGGSGRTESLQHAPMAMCIHGIDAPTAVMNFVSVVVTTYVAQGRFRFPILGTGLCAV